MIDRARLAQLLRTTRAYLLSQRQAEGYWEGHLSSSALSTATAVSAFALADVAEDRSLIEGGVHWLAATQNADGGWGDTTDSPSNLATTLLSTAALTLAAGGAPPSQGHGCHAVFDGPRGSVAAASGTLQQAREYIANVAGASPGELAAAITRAYGQDRTFAVPILTNCALSGMVPWGAVPPLPFELAVFPRSLYRLLNLQVVSYALPALIAVGLVIHHHHPSPNPLSRGLRRAVERAVLRKLGGLQPVHGGFLEAAPLTAFTGMSLIANYGPGQPVARKCLEFLRNNVRSDGSWPIDTNLSVWVTTSALTALRRARMGAEDDFLSPEAEQVTTAWLRQRQCLRVHPFTGAAPGGFGWTHLPGGVPDADDTSGAVLALSETASGVSSATEASTLESLRQAVKAGVRWLTDLQNRDGGWPTFCRGWGRLPFDKSCPDLTAHALRALRSAGSILTSGDQASGPVRRGVAYLLRSQEPNGSWLPLWFGNQYTPGKCNPVLATARVLLALAHFPAVEPAAGRGLTYLLQAQNADGGWGGAEGVASSVEETALALGGLSSCAGPSPTPNVAGALEKGLTYLAGRIERGDWTEPAPIGLYFAQLWYAERLYPVVWTVEALGRLWHSQFGPAVR